MRDAHGDEQAAGAEDAPRLAQGRDALPALGEVIEGPQQQDGVDAGAALLETARIAEANAGQGMPGLARGGLAGLLDVKGRGVDKVDGVPARREPARVGARSAAHVEHDARSGRQVAPEQLARALRLQRPVAEGQALALATLGIVGEDLGWEGRCAHGRREFRGRSASGAVRRFWKKWWRCPSG
jgi:hypothetical protein